MAFLELNRHLIVLFFGIIATSLAEFPPKFTENPLSGLPAGHLRAFGYHRPPDGAVVEERGFLHPKIFLKKYVSVHKPMVFRQAVADSPAIQKWTDTYLASRYGDLDLLLEVKRENRSKDAQSRRINLSSFIERYRKEDIYAVTVLPDPMRAEVQVPSCLLCGTFRDFVQETNFWMSSGGTRSIIHYDADENLHCIINGSKDFMMMKNKFKKFLPMFQKKQHTGSGYSSMDPDSVDLLQYPKIAKVRWTYTTLYPGDCIYIPSEYLHQVRSYKRTISATILFTFDVDNSFRDTGCGNATFAYTPLSEIDVHWTYRKGDETIDMGYFNVELVREELLDLVKSTKADFFALKDFAHFYLREIKDQEDKESFERAKELFTQVFEVDSDGKVTAENIKQLPRENLKNLIRNMDSSDGPDSDETADDHIEEEENIDKKDEL